jgi:hypothetical protein
LETYSMLLAGLGMTSGYNRARGAPRVVAPATWKEFDESFASFAGSI